MIIALISGLETFEPSEEITSLLDIRDEPEDPLSVSQIQKEQNSNLTTIFPVKNQNNLTYVAAFWS